MDEIDRNIVVALQQDGSSGLAELAKVAGLSVSATAERVKRLEERGVIRAWRADLDPAAVGCPLLAHVLAAVAPGRDDAGLPRGDAAGGGGAGVPRRYRRLDLPPQAARRRPPGARHLPQRGAARAARRAARGNACVAIATVKESAILPVAPAAEE